MKTENPSKNINVVANRVDTSAIVCCKKLGSIFPPSKVMVNVTSQDTFWLGF